MQIKDTTKATAIPTNRITYSNAVNETPNFTIRSKEAPNITGIPKTNVYSAAAFLPTPNSNAPRIVAPEREVPGNTAAIN